MKKEMEDNMQSGVSAKDIAQNLKDAGCDSGCIEMFMGLWQKGSREEQMKLLEAHREFLLECKHKEEQRIDCLDYLIYQITQKRSKNENNQQ